LSWVAGSAPSSEEDTHGLESEKRGPGAVPATPSVPVRLVQVTAHY
jgi:hypothetical protein